MGFRKIKKIRRKMGSRTKHGNTKNARGSGTRGGKGMAGGHKHRFSICYKNFGIKIRMKPKKTNLVSCKLSEFVKKIPSLLEKKLAERKGKEIFVDCEKAGIEKIFGQGTVTEAIILKNVRVSESVKQEIESKGGKIEAIAIPAKVAPAEKIAGKEKVQQ